MKGMKCCTIAQGILEEIPGHPAAVHYLIHSYGDPVQNVKEGLFQIEQALEDFILFNIILIIGKEIDRIVPAGLRIFKEIPGNGIFCFINHSIYEYL